MTFYGPSEKFVIDITPPSSPEQSDSDSELGLEQGIEELSLGNSNDLEQGMEELSLGNSNDDAHPVGLDSSAPTAGEQISPLAQSLTTYKNALNSWGWVHPAVDGAREVVMHYIHQNLSTLPDVQLLVPAYTFDSGMMNKVIGALAYRCARGWIWGKAKEGILIHFFNAGDAGYKQGDAGYKLYQSLHAKIEECEANRAAIRRTWKQKPGRQDKRKQFEGPSELAKRISEYPEEMQVRAEFPEMLPIGANSMAELYALVYGLRWDQAKNLGQGTTYGTTTPEAASDVGTTRKATAHIPGITVNLPLKKAYASKDALLHHRPREFSFSTTKGHINYIKAQNRRARKPTVSEVAFFTRDPGEPIRVKLPPS